MYKLSPARHNINGVQPFGQRCKQSAFTLIEVVVGIVVSAIVLTFLSTVFFANPERSVEPLLQIRAAEFGEALMEEILGKAFDEATPVGGIPACTAIGTATGCTPVANLGAEEISRANYDDVDDYNIYCPDQSPGNPGWPAQNFQGNNLDNFDNIRMRVCVNYDGDFDGVADANINAKLITIDIYLMSGGSISSIMTIAAYRGNF